MLYHGTTTENAKSIQFDGIIRAPVCLTADYGQAVEYALSNSPDGVVIAIPDTDCHGLLPDNESSCWDDADSAIANGGNVYTLSDVRIQHAKFHHYYDYERVES